MCTIRSSSLQPKQLLTALRMVFGLLLVLMIGGVSWSQLEGAPEPSAVEVDGISGLAMLSFPYEFTNADAEIVLASLGDLTLGSANDPALIRWDSAASLYRTFPCEFLTYIVPGEGYWVYNPDTDTIVLPGDAAEVSSDDYIIDLAEGWVQIGCPFVLPVQFQDIEVLRKGELWLMEQAVARNYIQPALFSYNPTSGEYEWETDINSIRLDPFEGYWILAKEDLTFIFPPPTVVLPAAVAGPAVADFDGWQVDLVVSGAGQVRRGRAFGACSTAQEGLDQADVPSPPAALAEGARLGAEFIRLAHENPACVVDMRPANLSEYTWYLAVTTNAENQPIKVSWPSLKALPTDMIAILEDTTTAQKRYMRTTSSYAYNSGDGGMRVLRITVQPREKSAPVISEVTASAAPGGNWTISYTLSAAAAVQMRIRNISGIVIKHLGSGEVNTAGRNVMLWNGRSDQGTPVPNGRYLVEIEAQTPETGQTGRVISTFAVTR